jgi:hypothetical protein
VKLNIITKTHLKGEREVKKRGPSSNQETTPKSARTPIGTTKKTQGGPTKGG